MNFPQPPLQSDPIAGALPWVNWFSQVTSYFKAPTTNAPSLASGWSNVGGAYQTARYYIDQSGVVHIEGSIKKSTAGVVGETIFTLPTGYKPSAQLSFAIDANGAYGKIDVKANGAVIYQTGTATGSMSLSNISFKAA